MKLNNLQWCVIGWLFLLPVTFMLAWVTHPVVVILPIVVLGGNCILSSCISESGSAGDYDLHDGVVEFFKILTAKGDRDV